MTQLISSYLWVGYIYSITNIYIYNLFWLMNVKETLYSPPVTSFYHGYQSIILLISYWFFLLFSCLLPDSLLAIYKHRYEHPIQLETPHAIEVLSSSSPSISLLKHLSNSSLPTTSHGNSHNWIWSFRIYWWIHTLSTKNYNCQQHYHDKSFYKFWIRQDQLIRNALIGSLWSPTIISFIARAWTSHSRSMDNSCQ